MDKVKLKQGKYTGIKKLFYLNKHIDNHDLRPIINWCNDNMMDTVFLGMYTWDLKFMNFGNIIAYYYYLNSFYVNPIFVFSEISDMVAFKLRWSYWIIDLKDRGYS